MKSNISAKTLHVTFDSCTLFVTMGSFFFYSLSPQWMGSFQLHCHFFFLLYFTIVDYLSTSAVPSFDLQSKILSIFLLLKARSSLIAQDVSNPNNSPRWAVNFPHACWIMKLYSNNLKWILTGHYVSAVFVKSQKNQLHATDNIISMTGKNKINFTIFFLIIASQRKAIKALRCKVLLRRKNRENIIMGKGV